MSISIIANLFVKIFEKMITSMSIKPKIAIKLKQTTSLGKAPTFTLEKESKALPATWTITFSESVENHAGMQKIGKIAKEGYSLKEFKDFAIACEAKGFKTEEINLEKNLPDDLKNTQTEASVFIVRGGIKMLLENDPILYEAFLKEVKDTEKMVDKKAWMKGKVVNKKARYNLCYGNESQKADYEAKKGTVVAFKDVPLLQKARQRLEDFFGNKSKDMLAELNYYYDVNKCGIGFHGDGERRLVIGLRIGATMNLHYQWFHQGSPVGKREILMLNEGDLYIMSEKAVGTDWKKKKVPTLRHAAGASQYTTIKSRKT